MPGAPRLHAAAVLGRLTGLGSLQPHECIPPLLRAATAASPRRDPAGLRARLLHAFTDAAAGTSLARDAAHARVQAALRRLLATNPPPASAALRRAARAAGRPALTAVEADRLAAAVLAARLGANLRAGA